MKVLCNLTTKKIEGYSKWDDLDHNPDTHILIVVDNIPNIENDRLNNTADGIRPATQAELDADANTELDRQADFANVDPFLKGYVLAVNDGSIAPGSNMTGAALKAAIRAKM